MDFLYAEKSKNDVQKGTYKKLTFLPKPAAKTSRMSVSITGQPRRKEMEGTKVMCAGGRCQKYIFARKTPTESPCKEWGFWVCVLWSLAEGRTEEGEALQRNEKRGKIIGRKGGWRIKAVRNGKQCIEQQRLKCVHSSWGGNVRGDGMNLLGGKRRYMGCEKQFRRAR